MTYKPCALVTFNVLTVRSVSESEENDTSGASWCGYPGASIAVISSVLIILNKL